MYNIIFYENKNGESELYKQLIELAKESETNKDARIQFNQISMCIDLLKEQGTKLPTTITKHIEGKLWELRPGFNRILYFFYTNETYVLLHMFRKKTNKTPQKEIDKANREINDFISTKGGNVL